ncbi:MAG: 16S rRNA (uracil(1498)-N(3))-methyltransferase, partial [Parachlamydiaceae bacterium]|nr:16S rRNA (uracil(1498)-N(3))-methyltransferase [Parachlamydiaceae bacterium]
MPAERYYFPKELQEGNTITLDGVEFHHLINVMRNRVNDSVELINGLGQLAKAKITQLEKKCGYLQVETIFQEPQLEKPLILAQAIPRLSKLEIILEKATELGMTEVWLFPSSHSEKKEFSENQSDRLRTILIAAMKQSGRLFLPDLIIMPPLKQWQPLCLPAYFG